MSKKQLCFHCVLIIFLGLISIGAYAQKTITGLATEKTVALASVTVIVKGTNRATQTDEHGRYSIIASENEILLFRMVGYGSKEILVGKQLVINVELSPESGELSEVVVTAMGISREKKALGYSVQKLENQEILKAAPSQVAFGMMGKVAGLNISQPNGIEGGSAKITIRGNTVLFGNNQALIVVDGVQVENSPVNASSPDATAANTDGVRDWGSFMNFINGDDVEDINVLKGPAAAALYGARGANGVILITTKKGGQKPGLGIDYNLTSRWTSTGKFQDMQNEYGYGGAIALWTAVPDLPKDANGNYRYSGEASWSGSGISDDRFLSHGSIPGGYNSWEQFSWYGTAASWGAKMDGRDVIWWDGQTRSYSPQPDNRDAYFRTGNTTTHNLAFSGGGDFGAVRVSLTRTDNTAVMENSDFDQTTANLGSSLKISEKLNAEVTGSYISYNRLNTPEIGSNNSWTKFMVYGMSRDYQPLEFDTYKLPNGSKNLFDGPMGYPYSGYGKDLLWYNYERNVDYSRNQLIGSVKLSADLTSWLNLMGRTSLDHSNNEYESRYTPTDASGLLGEYGNELVKTTTVNFDGIATIHQDDFLAKGFNVSLAAGASRYKNNLYGMKGWNDGPFSIPNLYTMQNYIETNLTELAKHVPTEQRSARIINSVYGIMDLSYNNYLFLQLTGRNDWDSSLPTSNNSFFYPSASGSFVFTDALDMGDVRSWLDMGKLRLAYGSSANGTDPYVANYTYTTTIFGGQPTRSIPTTLPPLFLVPQKSSSIEAGVQFAFLKNRLNLDFTYYTISSSNQILEAPVSYASGVEKVRINSAKLKNRGFEFIIDGTPIKNEHFNWNIKVNGAHNQNKIISLSEGVERFELANFQGGGVYGANMYVEAGDNYGSIYGYDFKYTEDGEKEIKNVYDKGDPTKVVGTRYVTTDAPVKIGNQTPWLTGGLTNNFQYKSFSLYVQMDFKWGGDIYSGDHAAAMGNGLSPATLLERDGGGLPYTYPDGTTANHGVLMEGYNISDGRENDRITHYMYKYAASYAAWSDIAMPRSLSVFENSWLKMREVALTYTVPAEWIQKSRVFQGMSVSLIGRDLFYIYKSLPENLNPEGINGVGNAQGFQWAQFPTFTSYGLSLKMKL